MLVEFSNLPGNDSVLLEAERQLPGQPGPPWTCALIATHPATGPGQRSIKTNGVQELDKGIGVGLAEGDEANIQSLFMLFQQG